MKMYYFSLGTHPKLSILEIKAVLHRHKLEFKEIFCSDKIFLIKTSNLNKTFINELGGTIKMGEVLEITQEITAEKLHQHIDGDQENKFYFGISTYNTGRIRTFPLGLALKKLLKKDKFSCRYVSSKENPLSSVVVEKNNLIKENGIEFVIIGDEDKFYLGKTISLQNFEKYSKIDYGRPARNDIQGMLPPKIAQIMLNLSQSDSQAVILDPFCGSGTVLQMAALLGYTKLIGADINHRAIQDTRENLTWLAKEFDLNFNLQLYESDVKILTEKIAAKSVDTIVFEPYMGPPLKGNEAINNLINTIKELTQLYRLAFEQFAKILKPGGCLVVVLPQFQINDKDYYVDYKELKTNFKIIEKFKYSRPGQKIIRNILVLK